MFLGRPKTGAPIRFLLPTGFRGFIELVEDKQKGKQLRVENGEIILITDSSGLVIVNDQSFLYSFHQFRASFRDGTEISGGVEGVTPPNELAVYGLGGRRDSDGRTGQWWIVGTEDDYARAIRDRDSWSLRRK